MADEFNLTGTPEYSEFIYKSRYARWLADEVRRESWEETVQRFADFWCERFPDHEKAIRKYSNSILQFKVMPSMRALQTAGPALSSAEVAGYNCAFLPIDHPRAFDEAMYISMCGTGVGFSVERQFVNKLPEVAEELYPTETVITVRDSRIGWASAFKELISLLYNGQVPKWDLSKLRPEGARLKTFGGRSSGPKPLDELFHYTVNLFHNARGRKLSSIECHDLMCKVGEVVVVGGVRRCLPGDTRIQTTEGLVPIKDVTVGMTVVSRGKTGSVVAHENTGMRACVEITHAHGTITTSREHRVAVMYDQQQVVFKEAQELEPGDRLVWDLCGVELPNAPLPKVELSGHFNENKVESPPHITTNVAWLIGVIQGDGCVQEKDLSITAESSQRVILEKARHVLKTEFGLNGRVSQGNGDCLRLRVNSSPFAKWLQSYVKISHEELEVPEFVMNSSKEARAAYLAGLFDADGRCRKDNRVDQVTTVYQSLAKDVVTVMASLGIGTKTVYGSAQKRRDIGVNAQDFWTVSPRGNTSRALWHSLVTPHTVSGKADSLAIVGSPYDFTYTVEMCGNPQGWGRGKSITRKTALARGFVKDSNIAPSEVLEITEKPAEEMFDIEVADLASFTSEGLVVHNSAMLSLSNPSDDRMRSAKAGQWLNTNPERRLANNSACYTERPDLGTFLNEWISLYESKSGERGVFSRVAADAKVASIGRRETGYDWGCNPCSEIILRPNQFCNLSEVIVRPTDSLDDLLEKVTAATVFGTLQSTLTNFKYLRKRWSDNCKDERLLGVSLTGIQDHPILGDPESPVLADWLKTLREHAIAQNKKWASKLGINPSAAVTTVKPSGTVSQLTNTASGIHPRFSRHYIRRVRIDTKDPVYNFLMMQGVPYELDNFNSSNAVFEFPIESPKEAVVVDDVSALHQLKLWAMYQDHWCEHKPSCTVYYDDTEFLAVGTWLWDNFDKVSGISFLPKLDHVYKQAPYEAITKEQYDELAAKMPTIDWEQLPLYEEEDNTKGSHTLACSGGSCEIVDLVDEDVSSNT